MSKSPSLQYSPQPKSLASITKHLQAEKVISSVPGRWIQIEKGESMEEYDVFASHDHADMVVVNYRKNMFWHKVREDGTAYRGQGLTNNEWAILRPLTNWSQYRWIPLDQGPTRAVLNQILGVRGEQDAKGAPPEFPNPYTDFYEFADYLEEELTQARQCCLERHLCGTKLNKHEYTKRIQHLFNVSVLCVIAIEVLQHAKNELFKTNEDKS